MIKALLITFLTATLAHAQGYDARTADYLRALRIGAAGGGWPNNQFDLSDALADGVIAYYRMEDDTYDEVSSTTGTLVGTGTTFVDSPFGSRALRAGQANGNYMLTAEDTGYVSTETNDGYTFMLWVRLDGSLISSGSPLSFRDPSSQPSSFFYYRNTSDNISVLVSSGIGSGTAAAVGSTNAPPVVGEWRHLAATYTHGTDRRVRLYENGELSSTSGQKSTAQINQPVAWAVGVDLFSESRRWDGTFDEVIIFDKPLSGDDIRAIYENYSAP